MYFDLVSRKRFAKASRAMGKGGGCRVYGWLLMAVLGAGQVRAQDGCMDQPPACELSFSPSANLLLGESFNVTCTINSDECVRDCYDARFVYTALNGGSIPSNEFESIPNWFIMLQDPPSNGCNHTLSINFEADSLQYDYFDHINNAKWQALTILSSDLAKRNPSTEHTTTVQVLLSDIPQESVRSNIVQPLDIMMNVIALSSSQPIEGSYRAKVMIEWPHARSLESLDGTYFNREYLINGTTPAGSKGELTRTAANSTELTLKSEPAAQNLTLITVNQLGVGKNTTTFQISWHEPSIRLSQQNDSSWRMEVNFTEPVTDLMVNDSRMESVDLNDLGITAITGNDLINSILTFTANLMVGQNYTMRLNLQNLTTTEENLNTGNSNSGISTQARPQLLVGAVIAAITVSRLMNARTP